MPSTELHPSWTTADADEANALRHEADREIAAGHELHGLTMDVAARCRRCPAVAFRVEDGTFAIVELSQSGEAEMPPSPATIRCESRIDFELAMDSHQH